MSDEYCCDHGYGDYGYGCSECESARDQRDELEAATERAEKAEARLKDLEDRIRNLAAADAMKAACIAELEEVLGHKVFTSRGAGDDRVRSGSPVDSRSTDSTGFGVRSGNGTPTLGSQISQFTCPTCGREHSGVSCDFLDSMGIPRNPDLAALAQRRIAEGESNAPVSDSSTEAGVSDQTVGRDAVPQVVHKDILLQGVPPLQPLVQPLVVGRENLVPARPLSSPDGAPSASLDQQTSEAVCTTCKNTGSVVIVDDDGAQTKVPFDSCHMCGRTAVGQRTKEATLTCQPETLYSKVRPSLEAQRTSDVVAEMTTVIRDNHPCSGGCGKAVPANMTTCLGCTFQPEPRAKEPKAQASCGHAFAPGNGPVCDMCLAQRTKEASRELCNKLGCDPKNPNLRCLCLKGHGGVGDAWAGPRADSASTYTEADVKPLVEYQTFRVKRAIVEWLRTTFPGDVHASDIATMIERRFGAEQRTNEAETWEREANAFLKEQGFEPPQRIDSPLSGLVTRLTEHAELRGRECSKSGWVGKARALLVEAAMQLTLRPDPRLESSLLRMSTLESALRRHVICPGGSEFECDYHCKECGAYWPDREDEKHHPQCALHESVPRTDISLPARDWTGNCGKCGEPQFAPRPEPLVTRLDDIIEECVRVIEAEMSNRSGSENYSIRNVLNDIRGRMLLLKRGT